MADYGRTKRELEQEEADKMARGTKTPKTKRPKKLKPLPRKQALEFLSEIDSEGLGYWLTGYSSETFPGTEWEPLIIAARTALEALERKLEDLGEQYTDNLDTRQDG